MPPIHRLVESGSARAIMPPAKPPISAAAKPDALHHGGIGRLVEADLEHERRGQHAGEGVAEFEQHDEQQDGDGRDGRVRKSAKAP